MVRKLGRSGYRDPRHGGFGARLLKFLAMALVLAAVAGAVAVAFMDIPPPERLIEADAALSGVDAE